MSVITSEARIRQELQTAFDQVDSQAVALHTDLLRIGFAPRLGSRNEQLAKYFSLLVDVSKGRTLLFPTFNYDFCQTGIYDVEADPCQVGALNEYVRQLYPEQRSLTPIFNFCIYNNHSFSLEPMDNPFSKSSTFGELAHHHATVIFFGASFAANPFIHHVEEVMNIGYRYIKPFPGLIRLGSMQRHIVVHYRVRPLIDDAVDYDWARLFIDLLHNGLLQKFPLGNGQLLSYRADRLLDYWCMRLRKGELYLLTPSSKKQVEELYKRYGSPLQYEFIERL
jgi:aminoglycoside 3-N-acetyltransferase